VGVATIALAKDDEGVVDQLLEQRAALAADGTTVEYGGYRFQNGGVPTTEVFGLLAAVVILLMAFGSLVAMGLPIVTALFGIAIGLGA
jgi:RND superfamily putative drug exporter